MEIDIVPRMFEIPGTKKVFFRQMRMGTGGRTSSVVKFRTMVHDAESQGRRRARELTPRRRPEDCSKAPERPADYSHRSFVVGYSVNPIAREYLSNFKMGNGPMYLFYVPWHVPQAEAPLTAARAVLFRDAAVAPLDGPRCEVATIAERDLRAGEELDGVGGFTCYGTIDNVDVSRREHLLPMGLSEGCVLVADVPVDQPVTYDDVRVPNGRLIDFLRLEQEALFSSR